MKKEKEKGGEETTTAAATKEEEGLSTLTPSRQTRSMTRRNSLLSPPPAGLVVKQKEEDTDALVVVVAAAAPEKPQEAKQQEAPTQPAASAPTPVPTQQQQKQQAPPAGIPSSTTTHRQTDKENQAHNNNTANTRRQHKQEPTTKDKAPTSTTSAPLDPKTRLSNADNELIAATLLHRTTLTTTLTSRLTHLQQLAELWQKGKVPETLRLLSRLHEANPQDNGRLTVLADFLHAIDLQLTAVECGPLTLEAASPLLPVVRSLLMIDFETHVLAGLKTLEALVALFGAFVLDVLQTPTARGVDLSREERVEKCQAFQQTMEKIQPRVVVLGKSKAFKVGSAVHEAAVRVQGQLEGYLSSAASKK